MSSIDKVNWTRSRITEAVQYLNSGRTQLPPSIAQTSDTSQRRFKRLLDDPGFSVLDGKLLYNTLPVVPKEDIPFILRNLYYSGFNVFGRDKLYHAVKIKYVGISKQDIMEWLRKQETWQVHNPLPRARSRRTIQPIVRDHPNTTWAIDLVIFLKFEDSNMKDGVKLRYACNIIDLHSKYAWSVALSRKLGEQVVAALDAVVQDNNGVYPKQILSDNGGEFVDEDFESWCVQHNVEHIKTHPFTPHENGAIERFNLTFKQAMFKLMTAYKTKRWIGLVEKWLLTYNNTPHGTTGFKPVQLQFASSRANSRIASQAIKQKATNTVRSNPNFTVLQVGDYCRVSNLFWRDTRKNLQFSKSYLPNWSEGVYQVINTTEPREPYIEPRYEIRGPYPARTLISQAFLRHMLQKVPPPNQIESFDATLRVERGGFDRRQQTQRLAEQRRGTGSLPPRPAPPTALSERTQRPQRPIRPPRRPLDEQEEIERPLIRRNRTRNVSTPMDEDEEQPLVNNRRRSPDVWINSKSYEEDHIDILKLLLTTKSGTPIDVNKRDGNGISVLIMACLNGETEIVKLLLNIYGIDVNIQERNGNTALMMACREGNTDIVRMLLSISEIDVTIKNSDEKTAYDIAMDEQQEEIITLLEERTLAQKKRRNNNSTEERRQKKRKLEDFYAELTELKKDFNKRVSDLEECIKQSCA